MKNKKLLYFIPLYIILLGTIVFLLNMTVSDVKNNKNKLYENYLDTHMLITLYDSVLTDCKDINVLLKKDLKDKQLKRYELLELQYNFYKNEKCVNQINDFLHGGFLKYKFGKNFNMPLYNEVKRIKKLQDEVKDNNEKRENNKNGNKRINKSDKKTVK